MKQQNCQSISDVFVERSIKLSWPRRRQEQRSNLHMAQGLDEEQTYKTYIARRGILHNELSPMTLYGNEAIGVRGSQPKKIRIN